MDTAFIPDSPNTQIQIKRIYSWNHKVLHKASFLKGNNEITVLSWIKEALVQPIHHEK